MVFRWKETQYFTCVFNSQSYFKVHKTARLNATHFFIKEILNKRELQQKVSKIWNNNRLNFFIDITDIDSMYDDLFQFNTEINEFKSNYNY